MVTHKQFPSSRSWAPGLGALAITFVAALTLAAIAAVAATGDAGPAQAAFPGGNGKIAFNSCRDSTEEFGSDEIFVMNADGSNPTRLTNDPAFDWCPSWSPDGAQIAFSSTRDGWDQIYVMNADGSGVTRLTNSNGYDWCPFFSPD